MIADAEQRAKTAARFVEKLAVKAGSAAGGKVTPIIGSEIARLPLRPGESCEEIDSAATKGPS